MKYNRKYCRIIKLNICYFDNVFTIISNKNMNKNHVLKFSSINSVSSLDVYLYSLEIKAVFSLYVSIFSF